jgi:predicted dehydrogenase
MNRRQFVYTSTAGLAWLARAQAEQAADQKKLRVGLIGCGWYGKTDLFRLIQVSPVEVVSLCDVDSRMLADAAELTSQRQASHKKPRTYSDYRKMLAEKNLDIVLVGTPDHWHALAMIESAKAGADVYCQKPISVDVIEGQAMVAAARKYNRVVQVGTQRRSTPHLVDARENVVRTGKLGKVGLVEIYCYYHMRATGNPPDTAPPANLDYEMWTGPAPMMPYNTLVHPGGWRAFMEYGNGIMGDMGIHMFDMVRWMMNLGWPKRISSSGGILVEHSKANIADTQLATFEYDDVKIVWQHRTWGDPPDPKYTWGATLYGDKGTLKAGVYGYDFVPAGKGGSPIHQDVTYELEQFPEDKTEKDLEKQCAPAIRHHMQDFLAAIATRGKPVADIEEAYISTASCVLANLSMSTGRTMAWGPQKGCVIGDAEANRLLARPYRSPWVHPTPENV